MSWRLLLGLVNPGTGKTNLQTAWVLPPARSASPARLTSATAWVTLLSHICENRWILRFHQNLEGSDLLIVDDSATSRSRWPRANRCSLSYAALTKVPTLYFPHKAFAFERWSDVTGSDELPSHSRLIDQWVQLLGENGGNRGQADANTFSKKTSPPPPGSIPLARPPFIVARASVGATSAQPPCWDRPVLYLAPIHRQVVTPLPLSFGFEPAFEKT